MPITYSTELKVKTIRRYEKGESIKALSQELHISQSTLYQWRKEYCSIKTPNHTYTPAEFDAISRRLQKLEHHMEIIRQTEYLSNIPLQKKLATLEKLYRKKGNVCKGNLSWVSLARSVTRPQATGFALQNRTNTKKDTLLRVFFRVVVCRQKRYRRQSLVPQWFLRLYPLFEKTNGRISLAWWIFRRSSSHS